MVMETYYRKRPKKTNHGSTTLLSCQKEAEQVSITAAESPSLGRLHHVPPPSSSDHHTILQLKEPMDDGDKRSSEMENDMIKSGYLYEIAPKHLPPRTPVHFRSIRVAMVCEKTELNVAVRFPSKESLRAFFKYSTRETHPALDEKFVMGIALAEKVLIKLVPAEVFSEQKSLETFWLIDPLTADFCKDNNISVTHKKGGNYLSEALKGNGVMRWGIRRQVKYLGRHKEIDGVNGQNLSSSFINGLLEGSQLELEAIYDDERESIKKEKNEDADIGEEKDEDREEDEKEDGEETNGDGDQENEDEEEEEEEEEEDEDEDKIKKSANKNLKRKRYSFRNIGVKKHKRENVEVEKQKKKKSHQNKKNKDRTRFKEALILKNPKDRWSAERYKLAEENLLRVMKSKGATVEKPILRPQLRAEARKKIGDTGLLDHLLKHMAGKHAPGGEERFRRRHNPDGAMEYWLESADLVNVRKDAGITDPYWVPPPGWKPGDSPTQDPICARELKLLKDGITKMERDFMATKMQLEDEVGKLRRELNELSASKRRQEKENQAITMPSGGSDHISQKLDQLATSLDSSICDFGSAHVPVEKYKEQLMVISDFVKEVEENISKSTSNIVKERARKDNSSSLMAHTKEKEREKEKEKRNPVAVTKSKEEEAVVQEALIAASSSSTVTKSCRNHHQTNDQLMNAAEKAAKIQRMKSGFRICKPHGTFLWPNMVKDNNNNSYFNNNNNSTSSTQVMVQVEVPTPPSVNSSSSISALLAAPQPHDHQLLLVKPLAEKRAVKVTVSTVSTTKAGSSSFYDQKDGANNYSTNAYSTAAAGLINLNNATPLQGGSANGVSKTSPWESSGAYGPRNVMRFEYHQKENNNNNRCSWPVSAAAAARSQMPCQLGNNWLALSTLNSASDESTHG